MKDIEKIVEDICELAPELSNDQDKVRKIVASLLEAKPDVVVDEAFVQDLQRKLQSSIRAQKVSYESKDSYRITDRVLSIFGTKSVVGVAMFMLLVLVALPFVDLSRSQNLSTFSLSPQIKDTGEKLAFGSLLEYSSEEATVEAAVEEFAALDMYDVDIVSERESIVPSNTSMMQADGMGGVAMEMYADDMAVTSIAPDMKGGMIYPGYYEYPIYTYDGEMPVIVEEGYVYRRENGSNRDVGSILNGFGLGLVDLSSFKNVGLQRLELTTNTSPAYSVSVDMQQGEVSIYRTWSGRYYNTMPTGVPRSKVDNAEMIKISNAFLKKHGIDVSEYGDPEVEDQSYYAMPMMDAAAGVAREEISAEFAPIYNVNVRYPLIVDGMRVYEQGGTSAGINVSVNASERYVESVWGLTTQNYERSLYPQVTDVSKILGMLKNGGYNRGLYIDPEYTKSVPVPVSEPELVLMKYWAYNNEEGRSVELLVPALRFDVDQLVWNAKGIYVQDAIVLPIVTDIIEDTWDRPIPMPLMIEGDSSGAVSGGSSGVVESLPVVMVNPDVVEAEPVQ